MPKDYTYASDISNILLDSNFITQDPLTNILIPYTTSNIIVKDFSLTDFDTIFLDENSTDIEYVNQKKKDVLYRELNDRFQE